MKNIKNWKLFIFENLESDWTQEDFDKFDKAHKFDDLEKEFICRQCNTFLDSHELEEGKCPNCNNDEDVFLNVDDE